ncbi:hypothetical protein [Vibrio taketomensis]|uniref:hypothetical protein n=1 Tax=Vibrio taketomensis TaxID=2572923 RepID=UPI001389E810|nr:hypothetical protein [Vibrio taketomensis]
MYELNFILNVVIPQGLYVGFGLTTGMLFRHVRNIILSARPIEDYFMKDTIKNFISEKS